MEGLDRLQVYQAAQDLTKYMYRNALKELPSEEKWALTSKIRRAAVSIPANIAEGYGRYYYQETIRFCYLARGSLMELMSQKELSADQGFLSEDVVDVVTEKADTLLKLIHGYINYLKKCKCGINEPGSQHGIAEETEIYSIDNDDLEEMIE